MILDEPTSGGVVSGAILRLSVARTWSSLWRGRGALGGADVELQVARKWSSRWRGAGAIGGAAPVLLVAPARRLRVGLARWPGS